MEFDPASLEWKDAHEILVGAVLPRPIAFVSTVGADGVYNLAPFSFCTPIAVQPPIIGLGIGWKRDGQKKDTLVNIEFAKDFVINLVEEALAEVMNQASKDYPSYVDEFKEVGLTPVKGDRVRSPMVQESPINLECRLKQIIEFGQPPRRTSFVMGEVVRIHIKDEFWKKGSLDFTKIKVIGRLGEDLYCRTTDIFEMKRPEVWG